MTVLEREFASGHTLAVAVGRRRRRRRRRGCGGRRSVARFVGVCGWRGDRARVALGIRWRLGLGVGRRRGVEQLLPVLEQRLGQTAELVRVAALAQVVEHDADARVLEYVQVDVELLEYVEHVDGRAHVHLVRLHHLLELLLDAHHVILARAVVAHCRRHSDSDRCSSLVCQVS